MKLLRRLQKLAGKFINVKELLITGLEILWHILRVQSLMMITVSFFVSAILDGEYGEYDICTGVPAIITRDGIREVVELNLTEDEESRFAKSNDILRDYMKTIGY